MKQNPEEKLPILLFNDECGVCRRIGHWVQESAQHGTVEATLVVRPIGDDPAALRSLNPKLGIWDAYATIHLLMPDGSMKLGGEAVSEVFRRLPNTRWFSGVFRFKLAQLALNFCYGLLSEVRPLFGCESCGALSTWMKPIAWVIGHASAVFTMRRHRKPTPHFTSLDVPGRRSQAI